MITTLHSDRPKVTIGAVDWIGFHLQGDVLSIALLMPGLLHRLGFTITLNPRKFARCRTNQTKFPT